MKSIVIAALLAATGIVESVREVPLPEDPPGFPGIFEDTYQPRSADEIRVRLDDGRAITAVAGETQLFRPGQHVFVVPDGKRWRVEHAGERLFP